MKLTRRATVVFSSTEDIPDGAKILPLAEAEIICKEALEEETGCKVEEITMTESWDETN